MEAIMKKTVGFIVGSLRKASFNRSVANYMASIIPNDFEVKFIEIGEIPLYNEDLDNSAPDSWLKLRKDIKGVDAILFFTPEYNRSIPAALKNALDVASRPYGQNSWNGKPAGIISITPGSTGAFGANHHLRQILTVLNVYTMQQPEAYIGNIMASLDEDGKVVKEDTQRFLKGYMEAFIAWVNRF